MVLPQGQEEQADGKCKSSHEPEITAAALT